MTRLHPAFKLTPLRRTARWPPPHCHQRLLSRTATASRPRAWAAPRVAMARRQLRRREQPRQHGVGRHRAWTWAGLFTPRPRRDAQRLPGRLDAQRQRRQRQQELPRARVRLQPHARQRPVARRHGVRQRRHEHQLPAGRLQLRRAGPGQHAVRQRQPGRGPDAADRRARRCPTSSTPSTPSALRCCWATSASRPTACRPSTTPLASAVHRRTGQRHQQRLRAVPPASACAWATWAASATSLTVGAAFAPKMNMSQLRGVQGPVRRQRRLRHPVALHDRPGLHAHAGRHRGAGLPAHQLQRCRLGRQPEFGATGAAGLRRAAPASAGRTSNVVKLGVQWRATNAWTLRAGYNRGDNPIGSADVTFNILAPGVMKQHFTAGFSWAMNASDELSGCADACAASIRDRLRRCSMR